MKYALLLLLMVSGICQGQVVIWKADSSMNDTLLRNGSSISIFMIGKRGSKIYLTCLGSLNILKY